MAISNKIYDLTGNQLIVDGVNLDYNVITNAPIPAATQPSIVCGTGVPVFTAAKGTMFIRLDGAAATMLYINNNGATTWSVVTSV